MYADVWVYWPSYADEVPANHEPTAGFRASMITVNFGFAGISLSFPIPAGWVSYDTPTRDDTYYRIHWRVSGESGGWAWWFIFEDYAEFAVGVRVPQGRKPTVYASGKLVWYRFYIAWFSYVTQQTVSWVRVDPPPAGDILPRPPKLKDEFVYPERLEYSGGN
jgi:hypothetical protein